MHPTLPALFLERLKDIVPATEYSRVLESFSFPRPLSARINTLKATKEDVLSNLKERNISIKEVSWMDEALVLEGLSVDEFRRMDLESKGIIYRQGLSSMLPVLTLDPQPGESVLDMCAAPGSKATHIAARMENQGQLVCIEAIRSRYYKLKNVALLMGAKNISFSLMDARRFRPRGRLFDRILVDAPCSSEGRFDANDPETFAYWSPRKINEMAHKQKGLLLAAGRLLKPGGILVYSTCTFAPEENEGVVDWLLKKTGGWLEAEKIHISDVRTYPAITEWKERPFHSQVKWGLRVLPGLNMEGFFVAKFKKNQ
ncbi:MAG: RsmB/NOP family class I SAM-dependent RNA methyltransferase [Candidatus Omnitrophica bacterium]|nr:RsmB/NOP family class I SAM-dependent RNA methyltransferase [Candidatus Omnitrophota bacterium]